MGIIILTTLLCLAHLSAATCPQYRPLTADQSCKTNLECPSGKSCCAYSDSKFCVSTDPDTCISDGKIIKKGNSIVLKDNCTTCDCRGYDDLICTDDGCIWPKELPKFGGLNSASINSQACPSLRPASAKNPCTQSTSCSSGYTCCKYYEGSFCTLADPNTCYHKGKAISRSKMVILDDGCSECECQGHDSFLCTNDACFWPKLPKNQGCNYGGIFREHGSSFASTDGCNSCFCSNRNVLCTLKACMKNPLRQFPSRRQL